MALPKAKLEISNVMKNQRGESMFEVVLSLAVITSIIVGLVILAAGSIKNSIYSKNKTLAARFAQEATEWLRSQRDIGFADFRTNAQPMAPDVPLSFRCLASLDWSAYKLVDCTSSDNISNTILFRDVAFSVSLLSGKTSIEADVRVYWNDSSGYHEVTSVTSFSDWRQI